MREIKKGDKYLCNTSDYEKEYFIKNNIYEVVFSTCQYVSFISENNECYNITHKALNKYFTDLQEESKNEIESHINEYGIKPDILNETPKNDAGLRYNEGKERWSLVDFEALKPMVKVLEYGANKYDDHNWKKGLKTTEICESLLRHLTAYLNGEDKDNETGLNHTGHILCNAMFLSYMHEFKKEFDTRYKKPCCWNWDELGNCKCNKNG